MTTLEQEILEIINNEVKGKYLGKLKVNIEDIDGEPYYTLLLGLNQEQAPLHLGCPGSENDFKDFIQKEIHNRRLHWIRRWQGYMILPEKQVCSDSDWEDVEFPVIPF